MLTQGRPNPKLAHGPGGSVHLRGHPHLTPGCPVGGVGTGHEGGHVQAVAHGPRPA